MNDVVFALQIAAIGIGIVFVALALVAAVLTLLGRIEGWAERVRSKPGSEPQAAPAEAPSEIAPGTLAPETIAVISAAVALAISKPFTIKHIRYYNRPPETAWARQGRVAIMASHRVRQ